MRKKQSSCHPSFSLENVKGSSNYKINKNTSSLKPAYQFGAMTFICLFPFSTFAECTPTPDCASIGYTQTSCEGDYLACPFDSTKLKCLPCDSSFRYDCTGDNIIGGIGSTCSGKYASCKCMEGGYEFNNGVCTCPQIVETDCTIGAIYYPNGKCSNTYYACHNPVGVVVKDQTLIIGRASSGMKWGGAGSDIADLSNINKANSISDYAGLANTAIIVAAHIELGETSSTSAAIYCNEYAPVGMETTQGQWYLPAAGEIYDYIYNNYSIIEPTYSTFLGYELSGVYLWSSTEANYQSVHNVSLSTGERDFYSYKTDKWPTACFFSIE